MPPAQATSLTPAPGCCRSSGPRHSSLSNEAPLVRPLIPLAAGTLLINAPSKPCIGPALEASCPSADRIVLLCAFTKWSGLRLLQGAQSAHLKAVRVPLENKLALGIAELLKLRREQCYLENAGLQEGVFFRLENQSGDEDPLDALQRSTEGSEFRHA